MDNFVQSDNILQNAAALLFIVNHGAFKIHHAVCAFYRDKVIATNKSNISTVNMLFFHIERTNRRIDDPYIRCRYIYKLVKYLPNLKGMTWGQTTCLDFRDVKLPDVIRLAGFDESFTINRSARRKKNRTDCERNFKI